MCKFHMTVQLVGRDCFECITIQSSEPLEPLLVLPSHLALLLYCFRMWIVMLELPLSGEITCRCVCVCVREREREKVALRPFDG